MKKSTDASRAVTPERPITISFPCEGALRARDIVRRSNYRVTGKYPSIKMGRMMQWESRAERYAFMLLDADPVVTRYNEQPAKIEYLLDGRVHAHFPDLLIERAGARIFLEVKTIKEFENDPELQLRSRFLANVLPSLGFGYEVWLDSDIYRQPRFDNARFLTRLGRRPIDARVLETVRRAIMRSSCAVTMGDVFSGLLGNHGVFIICRAIMDGHVQFPAEERLDNASTVLNLR